MTEETKSKSKHQYIFIIILSIILIFISPLLGTVGFIMYAWGWSGWSRNAKLVFSSLIIIPFVFMFIPLLEVNILRPYQMNGASMYPNLPDRAYILTTDINIDKISRGDIVVHTYPPDKRKEVAKRVIGLPGETISLVGRSIYINGNKLMIEQVNNQEISSGKFLSENKEVVIPENSYFVIGDNTKESKDSREWGFIHAQDIVTKVLFCYWNCKN